MKSVVRSRSAGNSLYPGFEVDVSAIESAFRALARASLDERIALLQMLVERWYGPIGPDDGYAVEALGGLALPRALRWWMTTVGKKRIFAQNHLRGDPSDVRADCTLVFLAENQGCFELASPLGADDPMVRWGEPLATKWADLSTPVSIALLDALAIEIVMSAPFSAWSRPEPSVGNWLATHLVEATAPHLNVPGTPSRVFASHDVVAIVFPEGEGWIGAKEASQLELLKELGDAWQIVEREGLEG